MGEHNERRNLVCLADRTLQDARTSSGSCGSSATARVEQSQSTRSSKLQPWSETKHQERLCPKWSSIFGLSITHGKTKLSKARSFTDSTVQSSAGMSFIKPRSRQNIGRLGNKLSINLGAQF